MDFIAAEILRIDPYTTVTACSAEGLVPASRTLSKNILSQVDELERLHLEYIQKSTLFDGLNAEGDNGPWDDDEILSTLDYAHEDRKALLEEHEDRRKLAADHAKNILMQCMGKPLPAIRVTQGESVKTFLIDVRVIDAVPVAR